MLARARGVIALLLLPFAGQAAEQIDFGRYHALVIGINAYQDDRLSRLETAVNDASAVHDLLLRRYGFESRLLLNPTRDELVGALEKLRGDLSERDNLLIYYAGHGQLDAVTDEGYWLPVDAKADDRTKWVPISRVTSALKGMFAKHVLVVADSCYSGALTREGPVVRPGGAARETELRRIAGLRARMALTSGALEPVYDGGGDGYSVFARAFLDALRDNDRALDGYGLYSRLRQQVVMAAEQTPQYSQIRLSDHEGGDFIFVPKGSTVVAVTPDETPAKPVVDERAMELALWNAVKDSANVSAFEAYLEKYPGGTFAAYARIRIEELTEKQIALVVPPKPTFQVFEMDTVMVALKNANVRAEPSSEAEKVGLLQRGVAVTVTGKVKDADWYRVEAEMGPAYVYARLLADEVKIGQSEEQRAAEKRAEEQRAAEKRAEEERAAEKRAEEERAAAEKRAEEEQRKKLKEKQTAAVVAPPKPPRQLAPLQPVVGVYPGRKPGDIFTDCPECPEMVVIPAGEFMMGSPESEKGRHKDEGPQHRVSVRAFALGKYEVTFTQWDACVADGGCDGHRAIDWGWGRGNRPVINVSWKDAKAYVAWLSRRTGKRYRLPSEAEWEYAARAGTTTAFHFGLTISPDQANYNGHYTYDGGLKGVNRKKTVMVGSFSSNAFGLHDMHGNVWEWVEDCWHGSYESAPANGGAWTTGGDCKKRVLRGGSWLSFPMGLGSANRLGFGTEGQRGEFGFRVARTLD